MTGFTGGGQRRLWAKILLELPKKNGIECNEVIIDRTMMQVHGRV